MKCREGFDPEKFDLCVESVSRQKQHSSEEKYGDFSLLPIVFTHVTISVSVRHVLAVKYQFTLL